LTRSTSAGWPGVRLRQWVNGDLLPTPLKWRVFFSRQERNPALLKAGDVITASIATQDGVLDLGTQRIVVRDGA
jgi:hypothetical protein